MDAVTYPDSGVGAFINENVVPVRVPYNYQPLSEKFQVKWTPTLVTLDADGNEHHRSVGFLSPEELIPSLLLGRAKIAFDLDHWQDAIAGLEEVFEKYPKSDSAPEAIYLYGVCRYKNSHGPKPLKGARYFLVNGMSQRLGGLSQYAVGVKKVNGKEGTFRDAEDGRLSGNAIAQGSVDSVVALHLELPGHGSDTVYHWICAAQTWSEARRLNEVVRQKLPQNLIKRTADYWSLWVRKETPPTHL